MICCTQTEQFPGEINCMNTQELIKFMPILESETQDCVERTKHEEPTKLYHPK